MEGFKQWKAFSTTAAAKRGDTENSVADDERELRRDGWGQTAPAH